MQLAQGLWNKAVRRTQLHKCVAVEEDRHEVVGHSERPRRVGEVLRVEVAQTAAHRRRRDRKSVV